MAFLNDSLAPFHRVTMHSYLPQQILSVNLFTYQRYIFEEEK